MKAVVWHGPGQITLDEIPEPRLQDPGDAIVRLTMSAICGTDLHMVRGTMPGMQDGTVLGHEGVGLVEEVGPGVRNLRPGDRVVIPSTIACGSCSYCRAGYTAQCDTANPHGHLAGTSFFGGPSATGPVNGLQAQYARIPFAASTLVPLPEWISDEEAILLSDILPTAWFGAELAEIHSGNTVAVFGCGPVGQLAIVAAQRKRAGRVIAVDRSPSRLDLARAQHAEVVDFGREDPVAVIRDLTGGIGTDRVIDAVGVDAESPSAGADETDTFSEEVKEATGGSPTAWSAEAAPTQAARWAVQAVAKAGTIGIIGVYPPTLTHWPIGEAMNRNLSVNMGNCHHRTYIPKLIRLISTGVLDPIKVLTQVEPMPDAIQAYQAFDNRDPGWIKVALTPAEA